MLVSDNHLDRSSGYQDGVQRFSLDLLLSILGYHHDRSGISRLKAQHQVEKDERVDIPSITSGEQDIQQYPKRQKKRLDNQESPRA